MSMPSISQIYSQFQCCIFVKHTSIYTVGNICIYGISGLYICGYLICISGFPCKHEYFSGFQKHM